MNRDWSMLSFYSFSQYCLRMAEKYKRSQRCTVNTMNQLKKSLFMKYNLLYKKNLSFAAANRPGQTLRQTILYREPHDYQINFVNIDSCHQYGILGAILQVSFLSKVFSGEE